MINVYDMCDCYQSFDEDGNITSTFPKPLDLLNQYREKIDLSIFNVLDGTDKVWAKVRSQRDKLLLESDWTQIPDCKISNKQAWATYRQTLRDLPQTFVTPCSVVWPIKPS